tara:strand:+ start:637 stop:786 length:150 start_codon:yes stop_codon:yes gene_type:complete
MSSIFVFAWLCAVPMVPLMLLIWALDKKTESTDREVTAKVGKRFLIFMG